MIKASPIESSATESLAANSKTLECWSRDPQALRVELSDGQCFIFPYTHFVFASLERTEDREVLHISFTTMTFEFTGRRLLAVAECVAENVDGLDQTVLKSVREARGSRRGICWKNRCARTTR